jgi:ABC-type phosphate transport system substrate-binding protein
MTDSRARSLGSYARRLAVAAAAALTVAAAAAPGAQANLGFVSPLCGGSAATGAGATFQAQAHVGWEQNFRTNTWCGSGAPDITYNGIGSGAGRAALGERGAANPSGARDAVVRFAGTDQAPNATQIDQIEQGECLDTDPGPGVVCGGDLTNSDDGDLRTIPVAAGAITIVVNVPGNCTVRDTSPQATDAGNATYRRFFAENSVWEQAFAADTVLTWGGLLPDIQGINGRTDASCQNVPLKRVVRADSSGTTFAFKQWLNAQNGVRGWPGLANTAWPNDAGGTLAIRGTGNPGVAQAVVANDGSIGYVDLPDARANGFRKSGVNDGNYWVAVKNGAGVLQEPTLDQVITDNVTKGANCSGVTFTNIPTAPAGDVTRGDWSAVTGANSSSAYGICALTYILAFDDNADVYSSTCGSTEEQQARTVFDYLTSIVAPSGQATLKRNDYAKLPTGGAPGNLRGTASQGVTRIDWCVA